MTHELLMQHCTHQRAYLKFDEQGAPEPACGYNAHCWDDWKPCTNENCPLLTAEEKSIEKK